MPGFGIPDCGSTISLIGEGQGGPYRQVLAEEAPDMQATDCEMSASFTGIGGDEKSSRSIDWPTRVVGHTGTLRTAVIPGKAPLLVSSTALHRMKAVVDFGNCRMKIRRWDILGFLWYVLPMVIS